MKVSYLAPDGWQMKMAEELEKLGVEITKDVEADCDYIIGMSVTQMPKVEWAHKKFPKIPMINYNWDVYSWVWDKPRLGEYDYKKYGKLLKDSIEVWCPSKTTVKRTDQWFGVTNAIVMLTATLYYDIETRDDGFVFNPLRELPDKYCGVFERIADELDIPYKSSNHSLNWEEYQDLVASCRLIVSPFYEASTGGLTCLEGYYLGKPVLASNSPYCGIGDYFGDRISYYQHDNEDDFKKKLKIAFNSPPSVREDHRKFVVNRYSPRIMALQMYQRLVSLQEEPKGVGHE